MLTYAFDIEIFPNFFSAIFINVDDEFDEECFIVYKDKNDLAKLREFINREITLVGYNNLYFDNVILNAILENRKGLYKLAQEIIENRDSDNIKSLRNKKVPYKSIDFKELVGLDISLKQAIIVLEWPRIQELPYSPDTKIIDEYVPQILSYNRNDILPLIKMWQELQSEIKLRQKVTEMYGVDVSTKSEGQLPNIIFEKLYSDATGQPIKKIKEGRTYQDNLRLEQCIGQNIDYHSPCLNEFIDKICDLDLTPKKVEYETTEGKRTRYESILKENLHFAGLIFNLGLGGIHTQDKPASFHSDNEHQIIDADVTSFYPNIVLQNKIKPDHLSPKFLEIFKGLIKERMEAKARKDKVTADILKISINAVFGKLGNPDYWLYDMKAFYSVTISGQLYLLSLVEHLTLNGIEVISANTDGVTCKVKKGQEDLYERACQQWQNKTGFELEFTRYKKYVRRDVNNYVALKEDGKLKRKGIFETKDDISLYRRLMKSYTPDIIPQALTNYFIYDIPVEKTLRKSRNIFDFMMSQRMGKTFEVILRKGQTEQQQQRVNRYYACTEGGTLIKRDRVVKGNQSVPREISILSGVQVQIANDIDKKRQFEDYKVDLNWYQSEIEKIIRTIEVEQLVLF